jgi:hypothetical protein
LNYYLRLRRIERRKTVVGYVEKDFFDKFVKLVDWEKDGSNDKQGVSEPH